MQGVCLNLLEATVALYPANTDGTPQLDAPLFIGAPAENLHGFERWLKKETAPTGAKYPREHPLVPQYEVTIGRIWALPEDSVLDWQADHAQYVLDVLWVEEETQAWHRKTFYGVTVNEHGWDAKDVENGLVENQSFKAQYMVPAGGTLAGDGSGGASINPPPLPAVLPYRVFYNDANSSVLLYIYNPGTGNFTAVAATAGRATIANRPLVIRFAGAPAPVVTAEMALAYRNGGGYRNGNDYRAFTGMQTAGIFSEAALAWPQLDFYYGFARVATITPAGIFGADFIEDTPVAAAGAFSLFSSTGALVGVLARSNLTAKKIQVAT